MSRVALDRGRHRLSFVQVNVFTVKLPPDGIPLGGLAALHPAWFYSDGTHLPEFGPGAEALAALIAAALRSR